MSIRNAVALAVFIVALGFAGCPPDTGGEGEGEGESAVHMWQKAFGGELSDRAACAQQTRDGGFIAGGYADSNWAQGMVMYLLKTNASGDLQWQKKFDAWHHIDGLLQTSDGGYILAGSGLDGSARNVSYLMKTNSTGNMMWQKTFLIGPMRGIHQTDDGGYIMNGTTVVEEAGGKLLVPLTVKFLLKTDSAGNELWENTFGLPESPGSATSACQTADGGFALTGSIRSGDWYDVHLVKTDGDGNQLWEKSFGDEDSTESANCVIEVDDGSLVITGDFRDHSVAGSSQDVFLLKTDEAGNELWTNTFGGSSTLESAQSIEETNGGGFIIAGWRISGSSNAYIIKTDEDGGQLWENQYGGRDNEAVYTVQQTNDGGYFLAGYTNSYGAGADDVFLIRTDSEGNSPEIPE